MTTQTVETHEIVQLMTARAQTYGMLARLFRVEVDKPLLEELRTMRFPSATGHEAADEGYRLLYSYLKNVWENSVVELAIDYVDTFIGHGVNGFSAAYPYESVHTSERRLLMQEARDEVLAAYRANNLKKGQWTESEDHIALELEFMQVMAQRTAGVLEQGNDDEAARQLSAQLNFLRTHLINWVPMLVSDMLKYAKTDFYQGLAHLTLGFIETDEALLKDLLDDTEEER